MLSQLEGDFRTNFLWFANLLSTLQISALLIVIFACPSKTPRNVLNMRMLNLMLQLLWVYLELSNDTRLASYLSLSEIRLLVFH
jgi:hypothetical protein